MIKAFAAALRKEGLTVPNVSVGATPSCSLVGAEDLKGCTEMHPGNYTLFDRQQLVSGSCQEEQYELNASPPR